MSADRIAQFLAEFTDWARARPDILGMALVGSHARGTPSETSDVDLVILASRPNDYLKDPNWIHDFGEVHHYQFEDYGQLKSLRVWYADGLEIEYGVTDESWAALPLDEGTREVISNGMLILFERGDILSRHQSVTQPRKSATDRH